jgi:hypothetical protein
MRESCHSAAAFSRDLLHRHRKKFSETHWTLMQSNANPIGNTFPVGDTSWLYLGVCLEIIERLSRHLFLALVSEQFGCIHERNPEGPHYLDPHVF